MRLKYPPSANSLPRARKPDFWRGPPSLLAVDTPLWPERAPGKPNTAMVSTPPLCRCLQDRTATRGASSSAEAQHLAHRSRESCPKRPLPPVPPASPQGYPGWRPDSGSSAARCRMPGPSSRARACRARREGCPLPPAWQALCPRRQGHSRAPRFCAAS